MRYNKLGSTRLFICELCLRTMTFGASGAIHATLDRVSRVPAEYPGWMLGMWGRVRVVQLAQTRSARLA